MLLLMKRRQQATKEDIEREDRRIRASKRDVPDYSDEEDENSESDIEQLQSRVRYTEHSEDDDDDDESDSTSDEEENRDQTTRGFVRRSSDDSSDYSDGYDSYESSGDERYEMQAKLQKKYQDPRLIKSIEIQKRTLDSTDLHVKKIESKKKLNAVWEGIIQRYSALGEEDQGDVVNLKEMYIEENTGHIERLHTRHRTSIWDDFIDENEGNVDTVQDPLNLLLPDTTPRRKFTSSDRSFVTPVSIMSRSRVGTSALLPASAPPKFELNKNKEITVVELSDSEDDDFDSGLERNDTYNHDPLNLLSPKKSSRSSFSSSQSTIQKHDPFDLLTPQRTKPIKLQSSSVKRSMMSHNDHRQSSIITPKRSKVEAGVLQHWLTPTRNQ